MAKDAVISIRVPAELDDRLRECAERLDLSKNDIVRHAVRAAVEAIAQNDYNISLPLKMNVRHQVPEKNEASPSVGGSIAGFGTRSPGGAAMDIPRRETKPTSAGLA